jgi:hypothetical protein
MRSALIWAGVVVGFVAGDALHGQATFAGRDSAGVRIVESQRGSWSQPWTIGADPITRIVSEQGQPFPFVWSGTRLSDGTVVVVTGRVPSWEVRWYSSAGVLQRSVGGLNPAISPVVRLPGDSVALTELMDAPRMSVFAPDGTRGRQTTIYREAMPVTRWADGTYLLRGGWATPMSAEGPPRVERSFMEVAALSEGETDIRQILLVPGQEKDITGTCAIRGRPVVCRLSRRFGRDTFVGANARGWATGDSDRAEVQFRGTAGQILVIARWSGEQRLVTADDLELDRVHRLNVLPDPASKARLLTFWDTQPPPPETMPFFSNLLMDDAGNVWAERYAPISELSTGQYDVIDPSGVWLGTVEASPGLRALAIGDDWLLGVTGRILEPESVVVLPINKD